MEWQHRVGRVAGSLGINADVDGIGGQQSRRLADRRHRLACVVPVDGHEAAAADDTPKYGNLEVLRLGDKGDGTLAEGIPRDNRVKFRPVVAHQEKTPLGKLLRPLHMDMYAHHAHGKARCAVQNGAVKAAVLVIEFVFVHKRRNDEQKQHIKQCQPQNSQ